MTLLPLYNLGYNRYSAASARPGENQSLSLDLRSILFPKVFFYHLWRRPAARATWQQGRRGGREVDGPDRPRGSLLVLRPRDFLFDKWWAKSATFMHRRAAQSKHRVSTEEYS